MPRKPTPKPKAAALPSPPAATQPLIVSPSVPVLGVFVDPATSTVRNLPGNITVERAVGHCVVDVTSKISRKFELAPPLDPGSMTVKVYPAAVGNEDPLTVTQPGGLITLISPNDTAIRRLAEKERENRALRARDFNQATQPPPPVLPMHPAPSPAAGQDDTTDVLKMMMERLNKQDAAIKEQGAELKAQRAELKAQRGENEIQATVITELQTSLLDQKRINERQEMKIRKLEATIEDQETTIADLQTALANEQEERKEEMRREKLERKGEMEYICQITAILVPLRLRILLDLAREKLGPLHPRPTRSRQRAPYLHHRRDHASRDQLRPPVRDDRVHLCVE
ncbi:hypothetical protein BV22DRAFT_742998 [Leucogyrophana mollusca]|uniref:Uncharacterized protein n=1 Tax=Leucogyrophana mollusca TaxID=85980 RepID=A0ACB8B678_9AGAM|nr:hypothetical protein BV22DRAFT_742998 [Leucogyrophana mollusca]